VVKKENQIFSDLKTEEVALLFNVTESTIQNKARRLGLLKSKAQKSKNIALRNKKVGRDLSFELIKEIASNFKTRGEFQTKDGSAYTTARVNKWLNDVCSHMVVGNYSIPQLILSDFLKQLLKSEIIYNTRKIIKPKELDIWIPEFKLAFEYDGKGWHLEENNKVELCEKLGIKLIVIKEKNRRYEDDIKNQLIENLELIRFITNLNITQEQIFNLTTSEKCFDDILEENDIMEICNQYTELKKFRIEHEGLYSKIIRLKKLDFFTKHMKREHVDWAIFSVGEIKKIIINYDTLVNFIKNEKGLYIYIMRNKKLLYLLSHLKRRRVHNLNDSIEYLKNSDFKSLYQLRKKDGGLYSFLNKKIGRPKMREILGI
jgi:hypothetical protein